MAIFQVKYRIIFHDLGENGRDVKHYGTYIVDDDSVKTEEDADEWVLKLYEDGEGNLVGLPNEYHDTRLAIDSTIRLKDGEG